MALSKAEITKLFAVWIRQWNDHNLGGVMDWMHAEVSFENWDDETVSGKDNLKKAWAPWFMHHGNFKFIQEDLFIDEAEQKILFSWQLKWPSHERKYLGKPEARKGVDVIYLRDGKIFKKNTYSKTAVSINAMSVKMQAV